MSTAFLTVFTGFVFVLPLCFFRNLSGLSFTSMLGLGCICYVSVLIVTDLVADLMSPTYQLPEIDYFNSSWKGLFSAFSTFVLAFVGHTALLSIVHEMEKPTPERKSLLIGASQGIVSLFYLLTTISGYIHFGARIFGPMGPSGMSIIHVKQSGPYIVAQLLIVACNILTFPLVHYPTRLSLDRMCSAVLDGPLFERSRNVRHYSEAVFLVGLSCFLALAFDSVLDVFGLFVSLAGSFVVFTIPAACFLSQKTHLSASSIELAGAYLSIAIGLFFFAVGTPLSISSFFA